jgi:TIR domain
MHEICISYSRRDISTVRALTTALSQKGVTVWVDRSDIQEGDAYDTQIEEAIAQTRVVIVLWSENSIKFHWVRAEAAYALAKHKLLPISIDQCQPPLQFMQIQTIDFSC